MEPELFFNGVGPTHASNTYYQYKEDVKLMKQMSLNSYRTSIAWTRLLPDGKTLNPLAVKFYRDYFKEMQDYGIEPIINLFHFDMPWWLMEKGGWEARESVDAFAYYATVAFEQFGDLVTKWATFNEPMVHIECGYMGEYHYPKVIDFKRAIQVGYHTALAHARAVEAFRKINIKNGEISIILNLSPVYAKSDSLEDKQAQFYADLFYERSFLDTVVKGYFPEALIDTLKEHDLLPKIEIGDKLIFENNTIDFLGVNYYQPLRVQAPHPQDFPARSTSYFSRGYNWEGKRINPHRGWEIYPEGIYDIAIRIRDDYNNIPWFVSENGMGVEGEEQFTNEEGIVEDVYRIEFIQEHLGYVKKGIEAGSNCFGYHMWTFVDCWSWLNAYKNRYGFYRVDLDHDYARSAKDSSMWLSQITEKNKG